MSSTTLTGLMLQYQQLKDQAKEALLFFRLGDFYELFYDDALLASKVLGITLTQRTGVPMCGVPHHASESYISKLVASGYKVALAEQIAKPMRGLAERAIVEIITPGTAVSKGQNLANYDENFVLSCYAYTNCFAIALLDVTRGTFLLKFIPLVEFEGQLINELSRRRVSEIITVAGFSQQLPILSQLLAEKSILINELEPWHFNNPNAKELIKEQFATASLSGFGLDNVENYLGVASALLEYAKAQLQQSLSHVQTLKVEQEEQLLWLDESSFKNLEILANTQNGSEQYTLFSVLNTTQTAMGRRLLRQVLSQPTKDIATINQRLDRVELLTQEISVIRSVQSELKQMQDIERLLTKVMLRRAHAKDVLAIGRSLHHVRTIAELVAQNFALDPMLLATVDAVSAEIIEKIDAQAPLDFQDGGVIARGWHEQLDYLHSLSDNSQAKLEEYAQYEREQTGLALRLKENRQLGCFFEVNKNHIASLPDYFERRGAVTSGERYITPRLKELEIEIASADERIVLLEQTLFHEIREFVAAYFTDLQKIIDFIANLDLSVALARVAVEYHYVRPLVTQEERFEVIGARHPVVELAQKGQFVANDVSFKQAKSLLITGPNMAGKSTYLRMTALIAFMAHIGSFVPASKAIIPVHDCIFCRVGASDNLARGQSTFLVEMSETARILRYASQRSLVIVDEVGRGTSSEDGVALARAIFEHLTLQIQSYTLFATHYHELTQMAMTGYANYSLKVLESDGRIYFTNEVINESASGSYGLYVAQVAGLPLAVIERAKYFLANELDIKPIDNGKDVVKSDKRELFSQEQLWLDQLQSFDVNSKTPLEALAFIAWLQKESRS